MISTKFNDGIQWKSKQQSKFQYKIKYNTCTLLLEKEKYVDANLDAPDNATSGNEPSSEMLTSQSQISE